ncbi:hypothetical protein [Streptomyces sp. NPDC001770]
MSYRAYEEVKTLDRKRADSLTATLIEGVTIAPSVRALLPAAQ